MSGTSVPCTPCDLLDVNQLAGLGRLLTELLFRVKHNGAVEKSGMGLCTLADRLLRLGVGGLGSRVGGFRV